MKICLVTAFPPSRDALNEYGFHLARELRQIPGISLTILGDDYSSGEPELDDFRVLRCWKFNSLATPWRVLGAIRKEEPDVVWFNLGLASFGNKPLPAFLGIVLPCLARLSGCYTHVTLHQLMETVNLKDGGIRFPLLYRVAGFFATHIVLFANSVSVMLPAYRSVLTQRYGRGSVYVRRHGIFAARPEYPDFEKRGNPHQRILAFGKWGTYKRLEPVVAAFDIVIRHAPEARLVIAGTDHPKTPGYLQSVRDTLGARPDITFAGYIAEEDIPELFQSATVCVLPYTSSAGSSGIAHLASTYGVPIIASDVPDFKRLAAEEDLAIDFFSTGNIPEFAHHLVALLGNRERQVEMALQNVSAAYQMSMPEIIRQYLRTFELRRELGQMRALSSLRRLPHWVPLRAALVRRKARAAMLRSIEPASAAAPPVRAGTDTDTRTVLLMTGAEEQQLKTGTNNGRKR